MSLPTSPDLQGAPPLLKSKSYGLRPRSRCLPAISGMQPLAPEAPRFSFSARATGPLALAISWRTPAAEPEHEHRQNDGSNAPDNQKGVGQLQGNPTPTPVHDRLRRGR